MLCFCSCSCCSRAGSASVVCSVCALLTCSLLLVCEDKTAPQHPANKFAAKGAAAPRSLPAQAGFWRAFVSTREGGFCLPPAANGGGRGPLRRGLQPPAF